MPQHIPVQRKLSTTDEERINKIIKDKKLRKVVKERIEGMNPYDSGTLIFITDFTKSSIPEGERNVFLRRVYIKLTEAENLTELLTKLLNERSALDGQFSEKNERFSEKNKSDTTTKSSAIIGQSGPSREFPPTPARPTPPMAHPKEEILKGLHDLRPTGRVTTTTTKQRTEGSSSTFPSGLQHNLRNLWKQAQPEPKKEFPDWNSLYEKWYKISSWKRQHQSNDEGWEKTKRNYDDYISKHHTEEIGKTAYPVHHHPHPQHTGQGTSHRKIPPAARLYLNAKPSATSKVYNFVQELSKDVHMGITETKMGDYEIASTARDVIVIYIKDHDSEGRIIEHVSDYQRKGNGNDFKDEVPYFTRPVARGVGIGDEPPGGETLWNLYEEYAKPQETKFPGWGESHYPRTVKESADYGLPLFSFSQLRARLLHKALLLAKNESQFLLLAQENFRIAGIDPRDPARQGQPKSEILSLLDMI